jgi:hypothetical protein
MPPQLRQDRLAVVAEGHATKFLVDEKFAHAAPSSIRQVRRSVCGRRPRQ